MTAVILTLTSDTKATVIQLPLHINMDLHSEENDNLAINTSDSSLCVQFLSCGLALFIMVPFIILQLYERFSYPTPSGPNVFR